MAVKCSVTGGIFLESGDTAAKRRRPESSGGAKIALVSGDMISSGRMEGGEKRTEEDSPPPKLLLGVSTEKDWNDNSEVSCPMGMCPGVDQVLARALRAFLGWAFSFPGGVGKLGRFLLLLVA